MKLGGFVFSLVGVTALITIFNQGRALRNETKRLYDLALANPVSEGLKPAKKLQLASAYGKFPLSFEANQGQANPRVKFLARGHGYSLFLTPTEAVLTLRSSRPDSKVNGQEVQAEGPGLISGPSAANEFLKERSAADLQHKSAVQETVLRMKLVGANPAPKISGVDELPGKSNYFIGNDPKKWRTNVSTYAKVNYQRVYPGVDFVYHGTQGQLEYDFVVAPGADPGVIQLRFEGAERLELDAQGDLVLRTAAGELRQHKPMVYQEVVGTRHAVSGSYVLRGQREAGFEIGRYDASQPLIIDPVLSYSTYLGGSSFDVGFGIAVDSAGNAYITGETFSANFPTTPGAFQMTFGGGSTCGAPPNTFPCPDAFVTKLNPTGTALVYSTYLGGSGFDQGAGVTVDSAGNAYVTGYAESTNFPTTSGAFQTTFGGGFADAFVTKLNPTGSALAYSTYLGGDNWDEGFSIAVDSGGNAYVAGDADSANFPTTPGAFQTIFGGPNFNFFDAFVTKLNPTGTALVYSTYLGGSGNDSGHAIALDSSGNAYVTGGTQSVNFPTTTGAFQMTFGAGTCGFPPNAFPCYDAFVTKLNATGTAPLDYSTYLGGSGNEIGFGIALDAAGNAYVAGLTESANFPTTPTSFQTTFGGFDDAFVTKLNPTGTAPLVYSTYLGGSSLDEGSGIAVDSGGIAYVTGLTQSTNFPTTPGALKTTTLGGDYDAFVTKLNPTGTAPLVYSTYLGGNSSEQLDLTFFAVPVRSGIAVDALGSAYVTGITSSTDFPTTPGAFQPASGGGDGDAFVAKIVDPNVEPTPDFTLTAQAPTSVTVNAGQSASFTMAVTGQNGFSSAVTFTCSSPAARTGCTANPASVTPPGNTTMTVTTAARSGMPPAAPWRMRPWSVYAPLFALVAVLLILVTGARVRRMRLALLLPLAALFLALVFQAAGCGGGGGGGGGSIGTPAGAYTITVTGTSGGTTHDTPVTLIVN